MQVQIKFKRTGSNSVYGSFEAGDVMRCSQEVAAHFVEQGLAWYTEPTATPDVAEETPPVQARKTRKSK